MSSKEEEVVVNLPMIRKMERICRLMIMRVVNWLWLWWWSGLSLSYREIIECRYIELFRLSKKISYRTSNIEYLDTLKASDLFCLFPPKSLRKFSGNSENSPKIQKILRKFKKFSKNSENSQKNLKIRRIFLKKKVFSEAKISYWIKKPNIIVISYRVEKKRIAQGW